MQWLLAGFILLRLFSSPIGITSPLPGETLRGPVNVTGDNVVDPATFLYSELAFAYANDPTGTWFLIATINQPVEGGTLATWDTTSLTDGDYILRLRVYLQDGTTQDATVTGLQVRNYSLTPTATAISTLEAEQTVLPTTTATITQTPTPAPTLPPLTVLPATVPSNYPTPTPLSANPAALTVASILSTFGRGALLALILFIILGIFLRLRRS